MKNKYFVTGLILFLLTSCENNKIHYLDHSRWFLYEENDTLIFKGDSSDDSYIISQISKGYSVVDDKVYYEHYNAVYNSISECLICPITGFQRSYDGVNFNMYLETGSSIYYSDETIEYLLGDTILKDIYTLEDIPADTINIKVKAIYYSDIYGIIRYDMYDDRVYELQIE